MVRKSQVPPTQGSDRNMMMDKAHLWCKRMGQPNDTVLEAARQLRALGARVPVPTVCSVSPVYFDMSSPRFTECCRDRIAQMNSVHSAFHSVRADFLHPLGVRALPAQGGGSCANPEALTGASPIMGCTKGIPATRAFEPLCRYTPKCLHSPKMCVSWKQLESVASG